MDITRYFSNQSIACNPLESLIDKYEAAGLLVDVDVDIEYKNAKISIKRKSELQDLLRSRGEPLHFRTYIRVQKDYGEVGERITHYRFRFSTQSNTLDVSSFDLALINEGFDYAGSIFSLQYCDESVISNKKDKIVFLAHSFDTKGEGYASRLSKFLDLLGCEVLSGEGFAPKAVSAKVRERLLVANLAVVIFSAKDDFTWLIQESTTASPKKPVLILVEEGVEWKSGIHGDIEYIRFPVGNIDASFIRVLEGLDDVGFTESYRRKTSNAFKQIKDNRPEKQ